MRDDCTTRGTDGQSRHLVAGKDYKQAATDAFNRAAVRFGIAHELYDYEQNWVQLDGEGRFGRPLEDPATAYARKMIARANARMSEPEPNEMADDSGFPEPAVELTPSCPKCDGRMWDNRATKRNPRAPDFKCRDRSCDGVMWQARPAAPAPAGATSAATTVDSSALVPADDLPF